MIAVQLVPLQTTSLIRSYSQSLVLILSMQQSIFYLGPDFFFYKTSTFLVNATLNFKDLELKVNVVTFLFGITLLAWTKRK